MIFDKEKKSRRFQQKYKKILVQWIFSNKYFLWRIQMNISYRIKAKLLKLQPILFWLRTDNNISLQIVLN